MCNVEVILVIFCRFFVICGLVRLVWWYVFGCIIIEVFVDKLGVIVFFLYGNC